jgi:hypothetical protein
MRMEIRLSQPDPGIFHPDWLPLWDVAPFALSTGYGANPRSRLFRRGFRPDPTCPVGRIRCFY